MKRCGLPVLIVVIAALSFLAGSRFHQESPPCGAVARGQILYYVDPMHPAYKSDKPGLAPDCGMELEPVYGSEPGGESAEPGANRIIPGTVNVAPEKQQLIGVRLEEAKSSRGTQHVRLLGRVAVDERRLYFLNAATDGWIRETFSNSTGSLVKKDEVLATCYAPEFVAAEQAYFYVLNALDRLKASGRETSDQIATTQVSVKQAADGLRNLGMGEVQIQALARDRRITENIEIRSPAAGFVLERNVSPGLRFERGKQLYRIADLSRVWVLADLFENESRSVRPGQTTRVMYQGRQFQARLGDVPPQFDPASRTLKVRLELDNPGGVLRPDMFVDVEYEVELPSAVTLPADAVLDSGLRKTVYVERGNGAFEPRLVETGWRHGDRVQIVKGLDAGDRVVVSGTFLLDSESRLRMAAMAAAPKDPVCGMDVDPARAAGKSEYRSKTYYFCSKACKEKFDQDPAKYAGKEKELAQAGGRHD